VKKFLDLLYRFSSSWTGTIIIVLFLIFFVAQSFVIPSGSMKRTQLIGDFLFAKKFSYGIPTPHLPWLEIPIVGGDEIIYSDKKLLIHFHEGDEYIKKNYPKEKIVSLRDKLWVENPYMGKYNRDNSNDSRFWGAVPYKLIVGKPWLIYMSLEHRSYDGVLNGDQHGSGKDHAGLKRVCNDTAIDTKECETLWNEQRYNVRWGRVGRLIESIQLEEPIQ